MEIKGKNTKSTQIKGHLKEIQWKLIGNTSKTYTEMENYRANQREIQRKLMANIQKTTKK